MHTHVLSFAFFLLEKLNPHRPTQTYLSLWTIFSLIFSFSLFPAYAQPSLVKDINTTPLTSTLNPGNLTQSNGILYFNGSDPIHGQELWRSDGTPEGTFMVADINPGLASSSPSNLIDVNGTLYFIANSYEIIISHRGSYTGTYQLWKTDGTPAGTQKVTDVKLGIWQYEDNSPAPIVLTKAGNTVFYTVGNTANKYTLQSTKGVSIDIQNSYDEEVNYPEINAQFREIGNTLYISGNTSYGKGLIQTDGTVGGTILIKEYSEILPRNLSSVNNTLFFTLIDQNNGLELWKRDGTSQGSIFIKNFPGISNSFEFTEPTSMNGNLFFTVQSILWKSDGTPQGTIAVKPQNLSSVTDLRAVNGKLFFIGRSSISGEGVWKSDGTEAGTTLVKAISRSGINLARSSNGILYFTISENYPSYNFTLWRTDGTATGTFKLADFNNPSGYYKQIISYADVNGKMFFASYKSYNGNGLSQSTELWKSDGTAAGTVKFNVPTTTTTNSSNPQPIVRAGNTLYFSANNGIHGPEIWKSDGTQAGTTLVKDINPGVTGSFPEQFTAVNSVIYFVANDSLHGSELWKSNGTPQGTTLVKDINPGAKNNEIYNLTDVNGILFFTAYHPSYGNELWKTDGTEAGTTLVKDIYPGVNAGTSYISYLRVMNGTLYFIANHPDYGWELWKSDGTAAGTVVVKDIVPGNGNGIPIGLINIHIMVVNNTLFFTGYHPSSGYELWKSDGTPEGTALVKDLVPSGNGSNIEQFIAANRLLYFVFNKPDGEQELWKSDGTEAGTTLFRKSNPGENQFLIRSLTYLDGNFYFFSWRNIDERGNGGLADLWKIENTPEAKAVILKDNFVNDYSEYYGASLFSISKGILYFAMNDGIHGEELWRSDGTIKGTILVEDINPGISNANSRWLTVMNNTLYFSAFTPRTGVELWKYDPADCENIPATNLSVQGSNICIGQDGKITIKSSEANVQYQAFINTAAIGKPVQGGGDITLTIPAVSLSVGNNIFTIKASGCTLVELTNKATITVTNCPPNPCSATASVYIYNPAQGTTSAGFTLAAAGVPTASSYTFQVSTQADFSSDTLTQTANTPTMAFNQMGFNQKYFARAKTNLSPCWGKTTSFTTAAPQTYTFVALPSNGTTNITHSTITANMVPGASSYTIELNTKADFTGIALVQTHTSRILIFAPLTPGQLYYTRVKTNLSANWGKTTSFTTGSVETYAFVALPSNGATNITHSTITANMVPGASSYTIELNTKADFTGIALVQTGSNRIMNFATLTPGQLYYTRVKTNLSANWGKTTVFTKASAMARMGVQEESTQENLPVIVRLYPNPFENTLTLTSLQAGKLYISVVDNLGRTVYQSASQASGVETTLDLAHLKAGVYVVKISTEDGATQILKVVKK